LIIYMALAEGKSEMLCGPVSLHTKTAIYCAEQMTDAKFTITPLEAPDNDDEKKASSEGPSLITCEGMGFINPNL
jgi:RNA 3'-terminal phosphate cyclase (ATP)